MIERYHRCQNCGVRYLWNSYDRSGLSSERYCPECQGAINVALRAIGLKFECRYRPIDECARFADVTWEDVLAWEADLAEERKTRLVAQRIGVGLMNLETGDGQNVRWVKATSGPHLGLAFKVSSWRIDPEKSIEIGMEYDLVAGAFTGDVWRA